MFGNQIIKDKGMTAIVKDRIVYISSINTRLKIALVSDTKDLKKMQPLTGSEYESIKHIRAEQ